MAVKVQWQQNKDFAKMAQTSTTWSWTTKITGYVQLISIHTMKCSGFCYWIQWEKVCL